MPDPKQILNGEVKYSLADFYLELKEAWKDHSFSKEKPNLKKGDIFNSLFMFILLSSEDKPMEIMKSVYKIPEKHIKEGQLAFEREIDIARHIQMRKYLDIYSEYLGGQAITLKILNLWIKDFITEYIKEGKDGKS